MTRSGRAATICLLCAVQESAMISRSPVATSGHTSGQYLVQATTRSSLPIAARITVALGCRQAMRWGEWSESMELILLWPHGVPQVSPPLRDLGTRGTTPSTDAATTHGSGSS